MAHIASALKLQLSIFVLYKYIYTEMHYMHERPKMKDQKNT